MPPVRARPGRPDALARALARDRLGVPAVLFFVLAGVAPLTVAAGVIPAAYQTTGLTGIPAAFLAIAVVLAIFAAGYVAMARHVISSGAFYAFIATGLGRVAGVGAAMIALLSGRSVHLEVHDEGGPWQSGQDADGRMHGLGIVAELAAGFSVRAGSAGGRIVRACFRWPADAWGHR